MRRPCTLTIASTLALVGPASVVPSASAATIVPGAPCYSSLYPSRSASPILPEMIGVLSGGTPGARFELTAGGSGSAPFVGTFDVTGFAGYRLTSYPEPGRRPSAGRTVVLTVREYLSGAAEPAVTGTTAVKVSSTGLRYAATPADPLRPRLVRASAAPFANQRIYGFLTRGTTRRGVVKRFFLGRANACGYVSARPIIAPRSYRPGRYVLHVNAGPSFDADIAVVAPVRITRPRR